MQDVDGLLDEIRQYISEFAAAISMSDLIDDFERLLQRRKSKQPAARPPSEAGSRLAYSAGMDQRANSMMARCCTSGRCVTVHVEQHTDQRG